MEHTASYYIFVNKLYSGGEQKSGISQLFNLSKITVQNFNSRLFWTIKVSTLDFVRYFSWKKIFYSNLFERGVVRMRKITKVG